MNNNILFDRLVPVAFPAGHMGTFLRGFLTPEVNNLFPNDSRKMINHEWNFVDIFDDFFADPNNTFTEVISILSDFYPNEDIIKIAAIVILNTKYHLKINSAVDFNTRVGDNFPVLLEFAKNPKYHQIQIPLELINTHSNIYIKDHLLKKIVHPNFTFFMRDMEWKNKKINCCFPDEKSWIPYYFLKYKSLMSEYLKKNVESFDSMKDYFPYIEVLGNQLPSKDDSRYITFNMYELVFNKNLNQVYEIDPHFMFTKEKELMLDLANTSSIEILNAFGLDYQFSINEKTSIKQVRDMQILNPKL